MRAGRLCNSRLNGGASRIRTCSIALLSPALRWGESRANPNRPLGNREIRTCSVAPPSPAHRRGESEPPNWATEKNAGDSARSAPNPRSPVRLREADRPKTQRNRGIFCDAPRCDLKVSATADWVAERVGFEPTVPFRVHALSRRVPSTARPEAPPPAPRSSAARAAPLGSGAGRHASRGDSATRNDLVGNHSAALVVSGD